MYIPIFKYISVTDYNFILFISIDVVEEKLTNLDAIDKYYKMLFHLCDYGNLVIKHYYYFC